MWSAVAAASDWLDAGRQRRRWRSWRRAPDSRSTTWQLVPLAARSTSWLSGYRPSPPVARPRLPATATTSGPDFGETASAPSRWRASTWRRLAVFGHRRWTTKAAAAQRRRGRRRVASRDLRRRRLVDRNRRRGRRRGAASGWGRATMPFCLPCSDAPLLSSFLQWRRMQNMRSVLMSVSEHICGVHCQHKNPNLFDALMLFNP